MPFSTDIALRREAEPRFPSQCVRCLADDPDRMKFSGSRFSWAEVFFFWLWLFRKRVRVEVPVCDACRPAVRWRKWLELAVLLGATIPAVVLLYPWLKQFDLGRQWNKLIVLAVVVVALMPYFLWSVLRPPAFDITVRDEVVEYEFANADYAALFWEQNQEMVEHVEGFDDDDGDDDDEEPR